MLELDYEDGYKQIVYALKQDRDEKLYNTWLHGWNQSISFIEFKKQNMVRKETHVEVDDILESVKNILSMKV